LIYFSIAVILFLLKYLNLSNFGEEVYIFKIFLLTSFLLYEIIRIKKREPKNWKLSPFVLSCFATFIVGYGITCLIYVIPNHYYDNIFYERFGPNPFEVLNPAMDSVFIGAIFMAIGYRLNLGYNLFKIITYKTFVSRIIKKSFDPNLNLFYFTYIVALLARLYSIYMGVYAYTGSEEGREAASNFMQILYYLGNIGTFNLLVISLAYFNKPSDVRYKLTFNILLVSEVIFGLLSGMKSFVIIPFVIPLLSYLIINKTVSRKYLTLTVLSFLLAYTLIEPFRVLRNIDPNFRSDPIYISETFIYAYELNQRNPFTDEYTPSSVFMKTVSRTNFIIDAARAIDYAKNFKLGEGDPDFSYRLYTIPLQAFIPRVFWENKPEENLGEWFTQKVWGWHLKISIDMTPFGFLYFAHGNTLIAFFFFIIGILQKFLFQYQEIGAGGVIIFVGLLSTFVIIDSLVNSTFISLLRGFPMLLTFQYFILKK
jgi:hypothetical protein